MTDAWPAMLDALLEAVWVIEGESLAVLFANRAATLLSGHTLEDMRGQPMWALVATPQDKLLWSPQGAPLRSGTHNFSHLLRADGALVPVEQRVQRVPLVHGRSVWMATMLDRSEQQQHEAELEKLLAELRATLDSVADGMLVCALDGRVRAFNQRLAQLWQLPRELLVQRNDEAIAAHMLAQVEEPLRYHERWQALLADPMQESTDIFSLRSGTVLERRCMPQLIRGLPVGRVFAFRDITHQAEIQASLRLAARVFESSLDAIFIADPQGSILRMNPGCERLVRGAAADWLGRCACDLFALQPGAALVPQVQAAWEHDGFWEGTLALRRPQGGDCPVQVTWVALRDDAGQVVQSIGFMRDLTAQRAAEKRIHELAYSDALTGLPNRLWLNEHIAHLLRHSDPQRCQFAVFFLDLDRFKNINDSLGHHFGDRVLQLVTQRLQACLRSTDVLCRLGGDEFVVYLHQADAAVAQAVAQRMMEEMARPLQIDGMGLSVQTSIGIALYPHDGSTLDELIKQADSAMYQVKDCGRGAYSFYQPQMNQNLLSRMQLEHALRQALAAQALAVHYQPIVRLQDDAIVGVEALLRWRDAVRGEVAPGTFIPLAEESGYIVTLGAWALQQAVRQAESWRRAGAVLRLAVNVSALEFRQPHFVQRLTDVLQHEGLPPPCLELEITETLLLQDVQEVSQRLLALAQLGVGLVIDDFGTGYSSLAYLKKLPIQKLKIDQSFVRGLPDDDEDRAIVAAVASMGQALGIQVLAEGVETVAQKEALHALHCHFYQGFLCSPAVPAQAVLPLLQHTPGA